MLQSGDLIDTDDKDITLNTVKGTRIRGVPSLETSWLSLLVLIKIKQNLCVTLIHRETRDLVRWQRKTSLFIC